MRRGGCDRTSARFATSQEITERAEALKQFVVQAATDGKSLYEIERGLFEQLLTIGNHAINAALSLQGTGDLGAAYVTPKGRELRRSANPEPRKLRTIFGQHVFRQFVHSAGANRKIDLRPIDARLGLSPRVCSQLMEEFTQMFCVESGFRQATVNFEKVFRQKVSVETSARRSMSWPPCFVTNTAADHLPVDRIEILDIVHVSSYIREAPGILCDSERQPEAFSRQRLLMIFKGGAKSVIRGLRHMATARRLSGEALGSIMRFTNYLKAHMARVSYDQHLKAG